MGGTVEKARDLKGTLSKLVKYLAPYKVSVIIVIIFAIASTIFSIIGPKILGKATTRLFEGIVSQLQGSGAGIDFKYIGNILLMMLGLVCHLVVIQLHPGMDHDWCFHEDHLQLPQRDC